MPCGDCITLSINPSAASKLRTDESVVVKYCVMAADERTVEEECRCTCGLATDAILKALQIWARCFTAASIVESNGGLSYALNRTGFAYLKLSLSARSFIVHPPRGYRARDVRNSALLGVFLSRAQECR